MNGESIKLSQTEHQEYYSYPVAIGIGSNVGDRLSHIRKAIFQISERGIISNVKISGVYETPALLPETAPEEWNTSFYNCAISGNTDLKPEVLLNELKEVEKSLGRIDRGRWGPREIDLDIICWGNLVYSSEKLTIPHPELHKRLFVIAPLAELLPDWAHPNFKENFVNCRHYYQRLLETDQNGITKTDFTITL